MKNESRIGVVVWKREQGKQRVYETTYITLRYGIEVFIRGESAVEVKERTGFAHTR